jgi:sarcosine oxidase, subunit gamma
LIRKGRAFVVDISAQLPRSLPSRLKPLTALGHDTPKTVTIGLVVITERFDVALASVAVRRGRDKDLAKRAKAAGLPLPGAAKFEAGKLYSAFWMTPETWMVEAPFATHEDIAAHLRAALVDAASITEQTDAWVRFDVSAIDLAPLIERLSNIDFAARDIGYATRTVIEHLGTYLIKRGDNSMTLYGPRASAQSLLDALEAAANSVL